MNWITLGSARWLAVRSVIDLNARRDLRRIFSELKAGLSRYRSFRLSHTMGASAQIAQLRGRVKRFMTIDPLEINGGVAEAGELEKALAGGGDFAFDPVGASIARTSAPKIFQRQDAVVSVEPLHADRIAADFVESANFWGRL
jgi:hypothetical protein